MNQKISGIPVPESAEAFSPIKLTPLSREVLRLDPQNELQFSLNNPEGTELNLQELHQKAEEIRRRIAEIMEKINTLQTRLGEIQASKANRTAAWKQQTQGTSQGRTAAWKQQTQGTSQGRTAKETPEETDLKDQIHIHEGKLAELQNKLQEVMNAFELTQRISNFPLATIQPIASPERGYLPWKIFNPKGEEIPGADQTHLTLISCELNGKGFPTGKHQSLPLPRNLKTAEEINAYLATQNFPPNHFSLLFHFGGREENGQFIPLVRPFKIDNGKSRLDPSLEFKTTKVPQRLQRFTQEILQ